MKNVKYILLVVVLIVISGGLLWQYLHPEKSTIQSESSNFSIEDTGSIVKIFIADMKNNTVLLDRNPDNSWTLNGKFEAAKHNVNKLLETANLMTVKAPVAKARYDKTIRDMASVGIKVEFYTHSGTPSKVIYIGTSNQTHTGNYMMIEGSDLPYLVHIEGFYGFLSPRFSPHESDWRTKNIFKYLPKDIAEITLNYPKNSEKGFTIIQNPDGKIQLLNSARIPVNTYDSSIVLDYLDRFRNINFESWEETKTPFFIDSVANSIPEVVYTVVDKLGNSTQVETFLKPMIGGMDMDGNPIDHDQDRMYARMNKEEFVIIQYYVFDPVFHELNYFLLE